MIKFDKRRHIPTYTYTGDAGQHHPQPLQRQQRHGHGKTCFKGTVQRDGKGAVEIWIARHPFHPAGQSL